MAKHPGGDLSLAESGALVLDDAAAELDRADNPAKFLRAMERNRRVWQALLDLADRQQWRMPSRHLADYALATAGKMGHGVNDDHVHTLIDINRQIAAELAAGCSLEHIRERAYFIWENRGRPQGQDLDHWILAEMETLGRH